jgi:hypothetical protein
VHGDVDTAVKQRSLDRGNEGTLAPGGVGGAAIAFGLDDDDPARLADPLEGVADERRLRQRERAAPRANRDLLPAHRAKMSRTA